MHRTNHALYIYLYFNITISSSFITENEQILTQMQQNYERLLQKAIEELDVLREQINMIQQTLIITRNQYVCF